MSWSWSQCLFITILIATLFPPPSFGENRPVPTTLPSNPSLDDESSMEDAALDSMSPGEDAGPYTLNAKEYESISRMDGSTMDYIKSQDPVLNAEDEAGELEPSDDDISSTDGEGDEAMGPTAYPALSSKDEDSTLLPPGPRVSPEETDEETEDASEDSTGSGLPQLDNLSSLGDDASITDTIVRSNVKQGSTSKGSHSASASSKPSSAVSEESVDEATDVLRESIEAALRQNDAESSKQTSAVGNYTFLLIVGAVCTFIMIVGIIAVIMYKYHDKRFSITGVKDLIASSNKESLNSILSDDFDPSRTLNSTTVEMGKLPKNYYEDLNACLTMDVKENVASVSSTSSDSKPIETYKAPTITEL